MTPDAHLERCPHCQSDASVRPNAEYRYKCNLCGKPRIPIDQRLSKSTSATNALLKQAHRSRIARIAWQLASVGLAGLGALGVLVASLSLGFDGLWLPAILGVFALIPIVGSVLAFSASRQAGRKSRESLAEAWQKAASGMYNALAGRVTPRQLAETMGISEDYATELLAEAEVQQLLAPSDVNVEPVRVRVSEEGDLSAADWDEAERALGNVPTQAMRARKE